MANNSSIATFLATDLVNQGYKILPLLLSEAQAISRKRRTSMAEQFAANVRPIIDDIKAAGVSNLRGIADALNARGIKTARDGQWQAGQVKRIIDRAA